MVGGVICIGLDVGDDVFVVVGDGGFGCLVWF